MTSSPNTPSRRTLLKTTAAAALVGAAPAPARANTAPQLGHHAATPVLLQFEVAPAGSPVSASRPLSAAPDTSIRPLARGG